MWTMATEASRFLAPILDFSEPSQQTIAAAVTRAQHWLRVGLSEVGGLICVLAAGLVAIAFSP
jgi:hypothetical protein